MKRKKKLLILIYPLFFAVFPALFLYATNIQFFNLDTLVAPILKLLFFGTFLILIFNIVFKELEESSIYASFFLISLFLYSSFLDLLTKSEMIAKAIGLLGQYQDLVVFSIYLCFFALTAGLIAKRKNLEKQTKIFGLTGFVLVVISLTNIVSYQFNQGSSIKRDKITNFNEDGLVLGLTDTKPDIYYIILDGYARDDVLKDFYGFNNLSFIDDLEKRGFFVAKNSRTNYAQTFLSLASSLNFDYIENLIDVERYDTNDRKPLYKIIFDNKSFSLVKKSGYQLVVVTSGYPGTQIESADVLITGKEGSNELENALYSMTPLKGLSKLIDINTAANFEDYYRARILSIFDQMHNLPESESPKFVFAHIMPPHPPFLFAEDGSGVTHKKVYEFRDGSHLINEDGIEKDEYIRLYKGQVAYLNKKVLSIVDAILEKSNDPPIIVIQADHGSALELDWESLENTNLNERFPILNAYYLPNGEDITLYDSITPVNTFRVIFNHYFSTNYPILDDKSFFSTWTKPYELIDVTERLKN